MPEAATLYNQYDGRLPFGRPASCCGGYSADYRNLLWELLLNELKRTLETRTVNAALAGPRPSIVLCDRGIFDSRAYLPTARATGTTCSTSSAGRRMRSHGATITVGAHLQPACQGEDMHA